MNELNIREDNRYFDARNAVLNRLLPVNADWQVAEAGL